MSNDLLKPAITLLITSIFLTVPSIILDGIILLSLYPSISVALTILVLIKTIYIILATAIVSVYLNQNHKSKIKKEVK